MTWTKEAPTTPGYYFAVPCDGDMVQLVEVTEPGRPGHGLRVWYCGSDWAEPTSHFCLWWPIPITPQPLDGKEDEGEVERIARVIQRIDAEQTTRILGLSRSFAWEELIDAGRDNYREQARAAIAAVRGGR